MFFEGERILHVRRMILSNNAQDRDDALAALFPMQKGDFYGIFKAMAGRPVTVRLLDPPLHEFLPSREALKPAVFEEKVAAVAKELGISSHDVEARIEALHESNPMLEAKKPSTVAGAGWASPSRPSTRCRSAPSSRRRATW